MHLNNISGINSFSDRGHFDDAVTMSSKINYNFKAIADYINSIKPLKGERGKAGCAGAAGYKGEKGDPAPQIFVYPDYYNPNNTESVEKYKIWCRENGVVEGSAVFFSKTGSIGLSTKDSNNLVHNYNDESLDYLYDYRVSSNFVFLIDKTDEKNGNIFVNRYANDPDYQRCIILEQNAHANDYTDDKYYFTDDAYINLVCNVQAGSPVDKDWHTSTNNLNGILLGINNKNKIIEDNNFVIKFMNSDGYNISDSVFKLTSNQESRIRLLTFYKYFNEFGIENGRFYLSSNDDKQSISASLNFNINEQISGSCIETSNSDFVFQYYRYLTFNSTSDMSLVVCSSNKIINTSDVYYYSNAGSSIEFVKKDPYIWVDGENKGWKIDWQHYKHSETDNDFHIDGSNSKSLKIIGSPLNSLKESIFSGAVIIRGGYSYFCNLYNDDNTYTLIRSWQPLFKSTGITKDNSHNVGGAIFIRGGEIINGDDDERHAGCIHFKSGSFVNNKSRSSSKVGISELVLNAIENLDHNNSSDRIIFEANKEILIGSNTIWLYSGDRLKNIKIDDKGKVDYSNPCIFSNSYGKLYFNIDKDGKDNQTISLTTYALNFHFDGRKEDMFLFPTADDADTIFGLKDSTNPFTKIELIAENETIVRLKNGDTILNRKDKNGKIAIEEIVFKCGGSLSDYVLTDTKDKDKIKNLKQILWYNGAYKHKKVKIQGEDKEIKIPDISSSDNKKVILGPKIKLRFQGLNYQWVYVDAHEILVET